MKLYHFIAFVLILFLLGEAAADSYHQIQARHLQLRNRDESFSRTDEWQNLARQLHKYGTSTKTTYSAKALFDAADIYERIHEDSAAESSFYKLEKGFPDSDLASLALYRRILLHKKNRSPEASSLQSRLLRVYPHSREAYLLSAEDSRVHKDTRQRAKHSKSNKGVVVIDAGHGGEDHGAAQAMGLYEKDLVLRLSRELAESLEKYGYQVELTRSSDRFVSLSQRVQRIQAVAPNAVISLHINASLSSRSRGIEFYVAGHSENENTRALVEREEQVDQRLSNTSEQDIIGGIVESLLSDEKNDASKNLANAIRVKFIEIQKLIPDLVVRDIRSANFYILKNTSFPTVLIELLYLTNTEDLELLMLPENQQLFINKIAQGIDEYVTRD